MTGVAPDQVRNTYLRRGGRIVMSMFAIQHVEAQRTMMEREIARAEALGRHFSEARWQRHRRGTETARPVASTVIRLPRRTPDPTFPPAAA